MPAQKPHASIGEIGTTAKFTRNLLTPLRSVFEDALNDDLITFNPFERIALTKLLKQTASSSEYEVDPFTSEERSALIGSARADERAMVQFWFSTGLRPGELMALRWPKLEWVANKVLIDRNQVAGVEKGPKTEAGVRMIDLDVPAISALTEQKATSFLANRTCMAESTHWKGLGDRRSDQEDFVATAVPTCRRSVSQPLPGAPQLCQRAADKGNQPLVRRPPTRPRRRPDGVSNLRQVHSR